MGVGEICIVESRSIDKSDQTAVDLDQFILDPFGLGSEASPYVEPLRAQDGIDELRTLEVIRGSDACNMTISAE